MDRSSSALRPSPAFAAYEQMAAHYDEFTAHHDYELWFGNLLPALSAHGLGGSRLLDVGCGTGKSFLPMLDRGWKVVGVDLSPAMLTRAKAKAPTVQLEAHDMRALPRLGAFDLVWCLDDAVNYLLTPADLGLALRGFRRNLAARGLIAFDVNTLASYRGFFAETHRQDLSEHALVWQGHGSLNTAPGSEVTATFAIERDGVGAGEVHRQRHFRPSEIEAALTAAGLELLAVFGHGYDAIFEQPLDESQHTKAVYIARDERR